MKEVLATIVGLVVLVGLLLAGPAIHEHFGKAYTNADRHIFKESVTYNEGVLDDLMKYKHEYETAQDDVEREAIATLVRGRFANYDQSKIENASLRHFLRECGL